MRLSPLSSQNAYASAKASPTHSLARTGVRLNPQLRYADFVDEKTIKHFIGFLNTHVTEPVHVKLDRRYKGPIPQKLCSKLNQAFDLLCLDQDSIRLSALNRNFDILHAHHLFVKKGQKGKYRSLVTNDNETAHIRGERMFMQELSHVLLDKNGNVLPDLEKPVHVQIVCNRTRYEGDCWRADQIRDNIAYLPLSYLHELLQNHNDAIIRTVGKPLILTETQDKSVIQALNIISEVLRPFNPNIPYKKPSHFTQA